MLNRSSYLTGVRPSRKVFREVFKTWRYYVESCKSLHWDIFEWAADGSTTMRWNTFERLCTTCSLFSSKTWAFQQIFYYRICSAAPPAAQLIAAYTTWNIDRFAMRPSVYPLRETFVASVGHLRYGTFVASVGRLRYVRSLSPQLVTSAMRPLSLQSVASAMWDLCRLNWSPPL